MQHAHAAAQPAHHRFDLDEHPRIDEPARELRSIRGQFAPIAVGEPGCPFASRCPHVMEICRTAFPPEVELGNELVPDRAKIYATVACAEEMSEEQLDALLQEMLSDPVGREIHEHR